MVHYRAASGARARAAGADAGAPEARSAGSGERARRSADRTVSRLSMRLAEVVKAAQDEEAAGGGKESEAKGASARSMLEAVATRSGPPAEAEPLAEDANQWPTVVAKYDAPERYPGVPSCQNRGWKPRIRVLRQPCLAMVRACLRAQRSSEVLGRVTFTQRLDA